MGKILRLFRPLIKFNYNHPFWVVGLTVLLAVVLGNFALQLKVDTDLANLLPESNPHVQAMQDLQETVGGETSMEVAIQSPSFEDNRQFARDLIRESLQLYDHEGDNYFFERAEFRKETDFLRNNALYFATGQELTEIKTYLQEEIQQAKEEANPFLIDFEEEETEGEETDISNFEESYEALIPSEYPISEDSTVAVVKFYPTGSKSDLDYLRNMFAAYDSLLIEMDPKSYNAEMEVEFGGRLRRHLTEIDSIMSDVFNSFASGISGVILLVIIYFSVKKYNNYRKGDEENKKGLWEHLIRLPVPALVIGIPLLISLCWTFGVTYFVLGTLNTMSSVLFVILFGMGIDYGLHYYARYIEFRARGKSIIEALHETYDSTGSAIVVSGLTTAFSLYILVLARFRGFSEFGFIAGSGILLALFCMLFIMPSVLVLFEKMNWIIFNKREPEPADSQRESLFARFPFARPMVIIGLVISLIVVFNYQELKFQYDFGELEPEFPEYEQFNELAGQVSRSSKRNPAYILADNQQQVIEITDKLRDKMENEPNSTIQEVEALPERFPHNDEAANEKLQEIAEIRRLLNDSFIRSQDDPQLDKLRQAAQTTQALEVSQIPNYFKSQFLTKEGTIGNFVMVYPSVGLADGRNSMAFKNDVGEVTLDSGETFYAASTSIIAAEMLELMQDESPYMVGATFLMVFILMMISFRSLRWAIIAMLPLIVGLLLLFGIMMLTGMMFNFYNLVVLPAILGIGEDNGVHLAHRYREEGRNSMWDVLSSTGQHVTVGSLTTILGFSGLLLTTHPGLQSIGTIAVIGIGMTLIAAITFLPALIQRLEDRDWIRF